VETASSTLRGGHPHCVALGNDNLVYVCDRGDHRIEVFDKLGNFKQNIFLKTPGGGVSDIAFSPDKSQRFMYVCEEDSGKEAVLIVDHATGAILGGFGRRDMRGRVHERAHAGD